jgi:hydroxymethylglutaryl-CoA lyase
MADAEQLIGRLPHDDGVLYTALVLNGQGLTRAMASGIAAVEISLSASDAHSRKNTGLNRHEALDQCLQLIDRAIAAGLRVRASVQCSLGCVYEGQVPVARVADTIGRFIGHGADEVALADTTGMGSPPTVQGLLDAVVPIAGRLPLALHLHDTRGLGLVNLLTALPYGIAIFDTALGGMGGCPFVPGAAGNIATEDTAHLLERLNIVTGVDYGRVGAVSRGMETFFQKVFPGRMHRLETVS